MPILVALLAIWLLTGGNILMMLLGMVIGYILWTVITWEPEDHNETNNTTK